MREVRVKCVLLGNEATGKTSIVDRYTRGVFNQYSQSTIGAAFNAKPLTKKGFTVKLDIWDTAGQEIYNSIVSQYFKDVIATIIVVDPTLKTSLLAQFKYWHKKTQENSDNLEHMQYLILINKIDHPSLTNKYKEISQTHLIFLCKIKNKLLLKQW